MTQKPIDDLVPPGGHHFVEHVRGETHVISGCSYQEVAERLLKFRLANQIDVGRPLEEVHEFTCTRAPAACHAAVVPAEPSTVSGEPSFTISVTWWMKRLWERQGFSPQPLVSETEANRRAEVCKACPFQKDWSDYGCGSCVDTIRRHSYVFTAGRETSPKVQGCGILGQENTAACFASVSVLPDIPLEKRDRLPAQCWRKKLL